MGTTSFYTYEVHVSVRLQHTFTEAEVEPSEEGGDGDMDPTDEALTKLEQELEEHLLEEYTVTGVEAWADFDNLLGVSTEGTTGD